MEKTLIDITDSDFAPTSAETYELVMLIGKEGIAYLTVDANGSIMSLKSSSVANGDFSRSIVFQDPKLRLPFGSVAVRMMHELTTFVPNRLFDPTRLPAYLSLLINPKKQYKFFSEDLGDFDCKLVYAVEHDFAQQLQSMFPGRTIGHAAAKLLPILKAYASPKYYEMFVNVFAGTIQVVIFDRQQLLLYNTYSIPTAADFLYFLMLPLDQLRLDPSQIRLNLSGEVNEGDENMRLISRFFKNVHFLKFPAKYKLPGAIKALPSHFYFDLYHQK